MLAVTFAASCCDSGERTPSIPLGAVVREGDEALESHLSYGNRSFWLAVDERPRGAKHEVEVQVGREQSTFDVEAGRDPL